MTTIIRQPNVTVSIVNASTTVENDDQRILFVAQKTSAGSATSGALVENIGNDDEEDALFGQDSMIAIMIRANKVRNQEVQVDAISLSDNGSAVAATGTITIVGTATAAGTLNVIVGSERNHNFDVAVASTNTPTIIAAAIVSAVNADLDVPVTAANVAGVVTFTAVNGGTFGNSIAIQTSGSIAGVTGMAVSGMSSGATDPTLTSVLDVIGDQRYQAIVWGYPSDTSELRTVLDARFNVTGQVLDGVGFTGLADTVSNLTTLGDALNSESLVIFGDQQETETNYSGPSIIEMPLVIASQFAGFRALRLDTDGFSISDLVITSNGPLDAFGGPALASKPYFNTPFDELVVMDTTRGFDNADIENLVDSGISVLGNNKANNTVIAGEIVTTYKTDTAGNPDVTFTFLNFVDTASQAREYFANNLESRFSQSRLTTGDIIKGRDVANELVIRSFLKRLFQDLSGVDFVLLEAGEDALIFFNTNLVITIDTSDGSATIQMTVPIVSQLREITATMKIAFSTTS